MAMVMVGTGNSPEIGLIDRAVRVSIRVPLVFTYAEGRVAGHSVNLSASGILGTFQESLEVWLTGQISIMIPDMRPIVAQTRIVRANGCSAAMSLMNMDAYDRVKLQTLIETAARAENLELGPLDRLAD